MPTHFYPGARHENDNSLNVMLAQSLARTASGNVTYSDGLLSRYKTALIMLDITAAATAVGDTLDVYVQKNLALPSESAIWTDFAHFTQALGNGGAKQFVAELTQEDITSGMHIVQDGALAAGVNGGPWGDQWRVKWVIAGATPSFTFSVRALLV